MEVTQSSQNIVAKNYTRHMLPPEYKTSRAGHIMYMPVLSLLVTSKI